jgi:hypothetical protein
VKISIWPGVSTKTYFRAGSLGFSNSWITCRVQMQYSIKGGTAVRQFDRAL